MQKSKTELNKILKQACLLLQKRPHSPQELYTKLVRKYPSSLCKQVIQMAQAKKWLLPEQDLTMQIALSLEKKNKSWSYIKQYLETKKLPLPPYNEEKEREKAHNLISKKFQNSQPSLEIKNKMRRLLAYRGFEEELIEAVLSDF